MGSDRDFFESLLIDSVQERRQSALPSECLVTGWLCLLIKAPCFRSLLWVGLLRAAQPFVPQLHWDCLCVCVCVDSHPFPFQWNVISMKVKQKTDRHRADSGIRKTRFDKSMRTDRQKNRHTLSPALYRVTTAFKYKDLFMSSCPLRSLQT